MAAKINILIVDTNKDFAELLNCRLGLENSFSILGIVNNGADAVEILNTDTIDLILLDLILPNVDGLTILSHIKDMNLKTKAIVLSALTIEKLIHNALALGAAYYLCKPFSFDSLISKIKLSF